MNAMERFRNRLAGDPVDRPPNFDIFMQFAAHHIGQPLAAYYQDYRVLVNANLAVINDFEIDIAQAISDPFRETADFGAAIEFPADDLPISTAPLLADPANLSKLKAPDPYSGKRMSDRIEAVRSFREQVGGEIPILGWVEGALAEAADLRSPNEIMMDVVLRPEWVEELLEICVEVAIAFARAQVEAGADIIGLGDAVGSLVSPAMYRRFALPYEKRIFEAVHEMGAIARLHICGDTNRIVPDMVASGADIIDLDWMVDMAAAGEQFGDRVPFCGNFDPVVVMLEGTPDEVYAATQHCIKVGGPLTFSNAGCEIPLGTPHANLHAQSRALWDINDG
ncbi:MAG: uroporphyrinogen decarboxylase family protein [Caldilineaceae bacterium]